MREETNCNTRHDSKWIETDPLAIEKEGQREQCRRMKDDAPRPSRPSPVHPRSLTGYADPPRWWGRMKLQPRNVNNAKTRKLTYRIIQPRRGQSGRIECIGYIEYEVQMLGEHPRLILDQRDITEVKDSRSHVPQTAQRCTRAATYHIW